MVTVSDYLGLQTAWCPGCGNFGILNALKKALTELEIKPHQLLMVSGIGQAGKLPHYTRGNVLNMLHGRTLPAAAAAKLVNPELTVIAMGGDGDGYGEGGNHFLHAMRRNHNITYLVHNNQIYGLTKGQASPTSDFGFITKLTPHGAYPSLNPLAVAIAVGVSFAARGYSGNVDHLAELIKQGIKHKGFALIDILQPCVTFNHRNTYKWYQERIYTLDDNYSYSDRVMALEKALEWGDKIPTGIIYRHEVPAFEEQVPGVIAEPLIKRRHDEKTLEMLLQQFM
jgi:2-oxoglutarate ferredoxin oxidoreductase subunit beta